MRLLIEGHRLPGRSCGTYDDIHVGVQLRRDPAWLVPADAPTAHWEIDVEVFERNGEVDFRGTAVQGRRGARFVYLTWGEGGSVEEFRMFRRAKLMLADVPDPAQPRVTATVDLADDEGMPRCARLRPPALRWS